MSGFRRVGRNDDPGMTAISGKSQVGIEGPIADWKMPGDGGYA
jgi:hypothetical protein